MSVRSFTGLRLALLAGCLLVWALAACTPIHEPAAKAALPDNRAMAGVQVATAAAPTPPAAAVITPTVAADVQVILSNFTFTPATLTVPAGTTVIWVNQDDTPHTVSAVDKRFSSGALDTGDQFSYRFTRPGEYVYFCMIHPVMTGKIIVQ